MVERAGLLTGIVELLNYSTLVLPIYGLVTDRKLLISGQFHLGFLIIVDQQFSKCAPRPRSTSIPGDLLEMQILKPDLLNQRHWVGPGNVF